MMDNNLGFLNIVVMYGHNYNFSLLSKICFISEFHKIDSRSNSSLTEAVLI
jgi:hypothetical protein